LKRNPSNKNNAILMFLENNFVKKNDQV